METILNLFQKAFDFISSLVMPMWSSARSATGVKLLLWLLHVVCVAGILVLLYWSQHRYFKGNITGLPKEIDDWFFVIVGALSYAFLWSSYLLWRLLNAKEAVPFPDIVEAWGKAVQALDKANVSLGETPIFLVLGRPDGNPDDEPEVCEERFFRASGLSFAVVGQPTGGAPLHVYATREAIYVTCSRISLIGYLNDCLASRANVTSQGENPDQALAESLGIGQTIGGGNTSAGGGDNEFDAILDLARREGRSIGQLNPEERRRLRIFQYKGRSGDSVFKDSDAVSLRLARLECLLGLIAEERRPNPAINGILSLVPFFSLEEGPKSANQFASDAALAFERDRGAVQRATRLNVPTYAILADMESAPGFRTFVKQFKEKDRESRVGQNHPLRPDLSRMDGGEAADTRAGLAAWLGESIIPTLAYKKFQLDKEPGSLERVTAHNADLFLLSHSMRKRQKRLGLVLSRGFGPVDDVPVQFGGCYLAASGADAGQDQAFVKGILQRLQADQNFISWTDAAFAEDHAQSRKATALYIAVGLLATAIALLLVWRYQA